MALLCNCPEPTELTTIPAQCTLDFGKDGKWIFQIQDEAGNAFVDAVNGIDLEASWTPLPSATDKTKVIITPFLEDVVFSEPDILEDSENLDGAPIAVASGAQLVQAMIRNPSKEVYTALKELECRTDLSFYRVSASGQFGAREIADTPATYVGFTISPNTFVVRDPSKGATKADQYKLMIQFYLAEGTYQEFTIIEPEEGFNPLVDIQPA